MKISRTNEEQHPIKLVGTLVDENDSEILTDFRFELTTRIPVAVAPYSEDFSKFAELLLMAEFKKWYSSHYTQDHTVVEISLVAFRGRSMKMRLVSHEIL